MERKDTILELLYECNSDWLSGEEISRKIGISRTAIWKYIKQLRESGYMIESSSRLGHRLLPSLKPLNDYEMRRTFKTSIFGKGEIFVFSETDSTNVQAFRLASSGSPEGSIVIADTQSSGRGRFGRSWVSLPGENIYTSLILKPKIAPQFAPRLTLVTAIALSDTLSAFGADDHRIKWPNDILFGERKISGILTEMKGDFDSIDFVIIGIGININSVSDRYPDDLKKTVITLKDITGSDTDRIDFLNTLLMNFEKCYNIFLNGGFPEILELWTSRSGIINRKIKVSGYDKIITGTVTEVTPDGNLIVTTDEGPVQVSSGDINYI